MRDVLVTGGAGFIGCHLTRALIHDGREVTVVDNLSRGSMDPEFERLLEDPGVNFERADLTDPKAMAKIERYDDVYHLAAVQGTGNFYEKPAKVIRTNLLSTINVLDWFADYEGGRLLFSSSSETYAGTINTCGGPVPTPEDVLLSIDDVFNPRWSYGGSKLAGELLHAAYGDANDIDYIIVRYHNIYGPRMGTDHVIPEFALRAFDGSDPFPVYGGDPTRAFCHVDDAVAASRLLMETGESAEIYHVGNDEEEITIERLAELVLEAADHDAELDVQPAPEGSVMRRCPDVSKLRSLGYEPTFPLKEGLVETVEWYRERYAE